MQFLDVPYADKDGAKALGARWNPTRKRWYVPDGVAVEPFAKWLPKAGAAGAGGAGGVKARVDAYAAKIVTGAHCFDYTHDCNPFEPCTVCEAALAGTDWAAARSRLAELKAKS
ncbi:DUF5710 domain-containing protein [Massilia sp. DD77]|uniref:DUF5710 domain-containing protein n=1 Tax=Massilia sp. DD77 TaxID=3109349 RepID=UPI002FFD7E44